MAEEVNHHHTLKVIENCQISPPPASVPSSSLPLNYLDFPFFYCAPVKQIFFYDFPHPTQHFLQTVLPILKHSLSLTLQHFFPFAAKLVFPPVPNLPHILYSEGDSVSFSVSESTTHHFTHLLSNTPREITHEHPFIPSLPLPRTLKDGTLLFPTMAIQVTVFPNSGDPPSEIPLPLHNREMIQDTKGPKPVLLENLRNFPPKNPNEHKTPHSDLVRHRFMLSRNQVEKLKKWVAIKAQSMGLESETLHLSTFAVTCSLFWVCKVKTESEKEDKNNNNNYYCFSFPVDWRHRSGDSIPSNYFGNCLTSCYAVLPKSKLVGENGICEAMNAIGSQIRSLKNEAFKGVELFESAHKFMHSGEKDWSHLVQVVGSPKHNVYGTDFGWGKPKLSEMLHADNSTTMCPSDCRDQDSAIEVELVQKPLQMKKFSAIWEQLLGDIIIAVS
ncbi:Transferase [Sesbania bispinosa]|nr:Transferase [Sesbania bispinosa]